MVTAILIDGGGVLFNNVIEETMFIRDVAELSGIRESVLMEGYISREGDFESGRMNACDVIDEIIVRRGGRRVPIGHIVSLYRENARAVTENMEGLRTYLSREVRLPVGLANNEARDWDEIKHAKTGYWGMFDLMCSSWRLGAVKPSASYFDRVAGVLSDASLERSWILVDDSDDNCLAAKDAGGRAVKFDGRDTLMDILADITRGSSYDCW